jgi:hypothetical protein
VTGTLLEGGCAAPDLVGPIEAWRVWRTIRSGRRHLLSSIVRQLPWRPREALVAECLCACSPLEWLLRRPRHRAPSAGCGCGIYGADLTIAGGYLCGAPLGRGRVIGLVSLWGTVVECEHGFRASHAYPRRLYVPADVAAKRGDAADVAADLAAYGVEVELLEAGANETLDALLERQPA